MPYHKKTASGTSHTKAARKVNMAALRKKRKGKGKRMPMPKMKMKKG